MLEHILKAVNDMPGREDTLRVTSSGLFVREEALPDLAMQCMKYFNEHNLNGQGYLMLNIVKLLTGMTRGEIYYLVEPKIKFDTPPDLMWIGNLLEGENLDANGLPTSDGSVFSCRKTLLKWDPSFNKDENIDLYPTRANLAKFRIKNGSYTLGERVFDKFVVTARKSKRLKDIFGRGSFDNKRNCLRILYDIFRESEVYDRKTADERKRRYGKPAEFRRSPDCVFIIEKGNIKSIYEIDAQKRPTRNRRNE